ncbi:12535_t:CDS:2, partial [Racocetra persica]
MLWFYKDCDNSFFKTYDDYDDLYDLEYDDCEILEDNVSDHNTQETNISSISSPSQ